MEFQTLKRSHLKRNIIIGVVCIAIISAVVLNFTRAKYRTTQSIPLVTGTINYSLADLNIVAITIDGKEVDTIPDGNYELTSESYCTVNGEKDNNVKLSYDSATEGLSVTPMTTKGTKCYLYFETATTKKVDTILGQIEVNLDTPNFSKTAQAGCSSTSKCEETNGIYEAEDDDGTTYYFRGAVDNNWVSFAGYYWRIIRINGDGSIRMIYSGNGSPATTGTDTQIGTNTFSINSTTYNNIAYVGYMYTVGQVHGLGTNSGIKNTLDSWYQTNIASKGYGDKVSTEAGFCGDREPSTNSSTSNGAGGTGTTQTYYGGYIRLVNSTKSPTLKCKNNEDMYTVSGSSRGNKALTNPVGVITADEVAMAGGVYGQTNQSYYLYTGQNYWTMSPSYFYASVSLAYVFYVPSSGQLSDSWVDSMYGVRPVINLSADVKVTGSGTSSDPFVVS